jgi:hypothetical protein
MSKLTIELTAAELRQLKHNAARDLRHPAAQARYLLRKVLWEEHPQNNKSATPCTVSQAEQVSAFVGANP